MKKILLLVLLLSGIKYIYAQSSHLKFDHFTVKDGLPERQMQFMKQDDQGYIWVGTQNGLLRYDGYKPKVYRFGVDKNALTQNLSAESILIDNDKNIWISTMGNGLFKYNRSTDNFIQYPYPQKPGKKDVYVYLLGEADPKGNFWCLVYYIGANQYQAARFNPKNNKYDFVNDLLNKDHLPAIADANYITRSADGVIWIGTDNGLYSFDANSDKFHSYLTTTNTANQKNISLVYEAPSEPGIMWLSIQNKSSKKLSLGRFDVRNNKFKNYSHETDHSFTTADDSVYSIHEDKKQRLWFGTARALLSFDRKTATFSAYIPAGLVKETKANAISGISESRDGSLWLTAGKGLLHFYPSSHQFERYVNDPADPASLSSNTIDILMIDRAGTLWAAMIGKGIDKVNPVTSAFITKTNQLNSPSSYPGGVPKQIVSSADGYLWFSNKNGIYKWKPATDNFEPVYKAKPSDGYLYALALSADNRELYFSTDKSFVVYHTDSHQLETYTTSADTASLNSNNIIKIYRDHTGLVWIGTDDKGLCSFDPATRKFKRYPFVINNNLIDSKDKLDDKSVISIFEDRQGTIWTGTNFGGLSRFERKTGKFKSYLNDGNQIVKCISAIFEDKQGMLWVSTYLDGLYQFNPLTGKYIQHFSEDNGLLFNSAGNVTQDSKGFIWVAAERGLTRVDPKNMTLKNLPVNSILPGKSISSYTLISTNNLMTLGLTDGITSFNPNDLAANSYPPVVHIEKVGYSDPQSTTSDSATYLQAYGSHGIELPHNQNRVTFNYVALHYANPVQNKYAYTLEGFDNHWIQVGTQRSVTYTNLPPGTYTLRVKAANSDGVWNEEGDSFLVIVDSPLWFRWWAWVIYVIVFVLLISGFIAYRSRQLKIENQELEENVTERTRQLSVANKELSEQQEEITTQRDKLAETVDNLKTTQQQLVQSEKLASLGELTAGIAHEIQNPLNFVNNFAEVSVELVDELAEEIRSDKRDPGLEEELIADLKQNLEKINHHGKRADGIVKNMLQHSRTNNGEREPTDINTLADEYMRLAYHGLRSKEKTFNASLITNLDPALPKIKVNPQDIGRVLLNLFNNAFYAVHQKQATAGTEYKPEITVTTSAEKGNVTIKVKDNGNGIPDAIKDKIMQPFFTTKPTGEGTGLGLSLSYDIVVKGHGGSINMLSNENEGSEFIINLPI